MGNPGQDDKSLFVFQYGSNVDQRRLNGINRLGGAANLQGLAKTINRYDLVFNVWSSGQQCAVASLASGDHTIYGALYRVPESRVLRDLKRHGLRTLDEIEGEGRTYKRIPIDVEFDGGQLNAVTYVGTAADSPEMATTHDYAEHILKGLDLLGAPSEYIDYVKGCIARSLARTG